MDLCSVCNKRKAFYWLTSLEPAMAFCTNCQPRSKRLELRKSHCGESEPDYQYENDYPKNECYLCGNKRFKLLNKISLRLTNPDKPLDTREKWITLPTSIEFERWTCKVGKGCAKDW